MFGFLTSSSATKLYRGRAATHKAEWRDHDFCLSWSHYTDTDPTSRERAATAVIEPTTSSPGVACSTDWATAPLTEVAYLTAFVSCVQSWTHKIILDFYNDHVGINDLNNLIPIFTLNRKGLKIMWSIHEQYIQYTHLCLELDTVDLNCFLPMTQSHKQ